MSLFEEFPKIARLSRECVITEKIDGTNAQILIQEDGVVLAGSRNRFVTPEADNFGFARWVKENEEMLRRLGPGRHFGEWWGSGIQRGYGLLNGEKRFSLFNVHRWQELPEGLPSNVGVVPVLYRGIFHTDAVEETLRSLSATGSAASYGFMRPEGIVIWHEAARVLFKKTIEKDEAPKSK